MSIGPAVVVRFSSLGDVVLSGAVTGGLEPVTFVTRARYLEVAARLPGVARVVALKEGDSFAALASRLPAGVLRVDLHGSLRARLLGAWSGGSWRRIQQDACRRHLRVAFKTAPGRTVVARYAAAAGVSAVPPPWIRSDGPRDALLVAPGSRWAVKRWPPARFAAVAAAWEGPVVVLGGPGEEDLCAAVAGPVGPRAEVVADPGFSGVLAALGRGRAALGNDAGLAHLCAAAGIPTVVVFGATSAIDGFWEDRCLSVEADLECRPCTRFGRGECPFGDHRCMDLLSVEAVSSAVRRAGGLE
ncbi:MAG: glycosyltransferase family 9 protein [Deltaproteobacteria bacterium]|nr:glycosyltransferase family 9 protein [Deltaproteobacteria bacterium]